MSTLILTNEVEHFLQHVVENMSEHPLNGPVGGTAQLIIKHALVQQFILWLMWSPVSINMPTYYQDYYHINASQHN